jgi:MoxR-like ATPase
MSESANHATPVNDAAEAEAAAAPDTAVPPSPHVLDPAELARAAVFEAKRVVVGQDAMLERIFVALLAGGHVLLEGVPGVAKTLTVKTVAEVLGGTFKRIQFTPDLVPADLVGTRVLRPATGEFALERGPVFCHLLLADEVNRAPAKVQSALLEVMQERQVTIGTETLPVPDPFLVLATENPIESEGTYPLPEAQQDRFLLKIMVGYPERHEEREVVARSLQPAPDIGQVLGIAELLALQAAVRDVYVDPAMTAYAVDLVNATRAPAAYGVPDVAGWIEFGASPRASIGLVHAGRALALLRGRRYVVPGDLHDLAADVLRHRLVLTFEALGAGVSADDVLQRVLGTVPVPEVHPIDHEMAA